MVDKIASIKRLSQKHAYTSIQMHESIGRKMGLPGTDHKYLGFIMQKGQMTAGELSVLTGLTTGAVTGLIDRFEQLQLVKRELDKKDRRKVWIVPNSKKIIRLLKPLYKDFQEDTDALFASFSLKELDTLERYFIKAMEIMDKKIIKISNKK